MRRASVGERDKLKIPKSVQESIPIKRIYRDGVFQVGGGKYSMSWTFQDINYAIASHDDQLNMFMDYCAVLNSLPTDATAKITINNRRLSGDELDTIMLPLTGDKLDDLRQAHNRRMTVRASTGRQNIMQDKYLTVSTHKRGIDEARAFFGRVGTDLVSSFSRLSSGVSPLGIHDRLRVLHDFFRADQGSPFLFDLSGAIRQGHDFRDYICPDTVQFFGDHFKVGGKYGRVLFLREYATYIRDNLITEITDLPKDMMLSIDIIPVPTDEAVNTVMQALTSKDSEITTWYQETASKGFVNAQLPYDTEQMRAEIKEYLDDLTARDQRMMLVLVSLVHMADSMKELNTDTDSLMSIGRRHMCNFATLHQQQEKGLNTVLPYGLRHVEALRTLTTESTGILMPFAVQEVRHRGGLYMGENAVSGNPIMVNRKELMNGGGFYLGVSGSGKSLLAKHEILMTILDALINSTDHIYIIDPEREFAPLVRALDGEVIAVGTDSPVRINALDMSRDYGAGDNPVIAKTELMLSIFEKINGSLSGREKSIIDRCTAMVYREFRKRSRRGEVATMEHIYDCLLKQPEPEAHSLALSIELFTKGSLNIFAQPTNVNLHNRLTCFDTFSLGKGLRTIGDFVILDNIQIRVLENYEKGIYSRIFADEIDKHLEHEYGAHFLSECWRRYRKRGGIPTGCTQNPETLLNSDVARIMLSNSEFLVMLNQSKTDRDELAKLLNISSAQLSYVTNAEPGTGLIRVGPNIVPFTNRYPADNALYKLISTKPGEVMG